MRQNYLYKCVDCQTVKAVSEDYGEQTWGTLSCKACGDIVTQHKQLVVVKTEFFVFLSFFNEKVWFHKCPPVAFSIKFCIFNFARIFRI